MNECYEKTENKTGGGLLEECFNMVLQVLPIGTLGAFGRSFDKDPIQIQIASGLKHNPQVVGTCSESLFAQMHHGIICNPGVGVGQRSRC